MNNFYKCPHENGRLAICLSLGRKESLDFDVHKSLRINKLPIMSFLGLNDVNQRLRVCTRKAQGLRCLVTGEVQQRSGGSTPKQLSKHHKSAVERRPSHFAPSSKSSHSPSLPSKSGYPFSRLSIISDLFFGTFSLHFLSHASLA